jgi:hypothetical protein
MAPDKSTNPPIGYFPDCRARVHAAPELVECLTKLYSHCPYHLNFGRGHYCRHPDRLLIAKRTEAHL